MDYLDYTDLENQVRKKREELQDFMFFKGNREAKKITSFPEEWIPFFQGGTDMIKGVHVGEDTNSIVSIYHSPLGNTFPAHYHDCDEHLLVLKGSIALHTPKDTYNLEQGHYLKVKAGIAHSADIHSGSMYMIVWTGVDENLGFTWGVSDPRPENCKMRKLEKVALEYKSLVVKKESGEDVEHEIRKLAERQTDLESTSCVYNLCSREDCYFKSRM